MKSRSGKEKLILLAGLVGIMAALVTASERCNPSGQTGQWVRIP